MRHLWDDRAIRLRDDSSDESISLAADRLQEHGAVRLVLKSLAHLAHGGVDAAFGIEKTLFAPQSLDDFRPAYQAPLAFHKQDQQVHWNPFDLDAASQPP